MASRPRNSCSGRPRTEPFGNRLRRLQAALLLIPAAAAATAGILEYQPQTERWVAARLSESLRPPPDLDRIASVLYGLVEPPLAEPVPALLEQTARLIRELDPGRLDCSQQVNLRFIAAFLRRSGAAETEFPAADRSDCASGASPIDLASDLFLGCRYGTRTAPATRTESLERLLALQRPDGGFGWPAGPQGFYLSSHAIFALHACGGDPQAVARGQQYLQARLPALQRAGMIDALLEGLLMLRKMGVETAGEWDYLRYIESRIRTDGSICRFDQPRCRADWHASALLLALQKSLAPDARGAQPRSGAVSRPLPSR